MSTQVLDVNAYNKLERSTTQSAPGNMVRR